jgi:hypothetical protein
MFRFLTNFLLQFSTYLRTAIQEEPRTHDFMKSGVRRRRDKFKKLGYLGWPKNEKGCASCNLFYLTFFCKLRVKKRSR